MRLGRRGVSEVYSALIVLIVSIGVVASLYAAAGTVVRGVEEAGVWVSRLASDSAAPVVLVPEVRGGDLWVYYESMGSEVAKILVVDPENGVVVSRVNAGGHRGEVVAVEGYDCRPVALAAVLESGAVKVYDARLDPRFAGAAGSPYFSCALPLGGGGEEQAGGTVAAAGLNGVTLEMGGARLTLVDYAPGPQEPSISWVNVQGSAVAEFTVRLAPVVYIWEGGSTEVMDICRGALVISGGDPVTLEPYRIESVYGHVAEGSRGLLAEVNGVPLYIALLCDEKAGVVVVALEFGSPARFSLEAQLEALIMYTDERPEGVLPPTSLRLVAPGSLTYSAASVYSKNSIAADTWRLAASLQGQAETVNGRAVIAVMPVSLAASGVKLPHARYVEINCSITVEALAELAPGAPAEVPLPKGPLRIAVAGYDYRVISSQSRFDAVAPVKALMEPQARYYIKVSAGGEAAEAQLWVGNYFQLPVGWLNASIRVELEKPCAPMRGTPEILEATVSQGLDVRKEYRYVSSAEPSPVGACKPHLIIVESGEGSTIVAVEPHAGAPEVEYLGVRWHALAPVVGGLQGQSDTLVPVSYAATLSLPPDPPLVTIDLGRPAAVEAPVASLPPGLNIALINGVAIAVYAG